MGRCSTHPPSRTPLGCWRCPSFTQSTGRSLATPVAPLSWCCMVVLEVEARLSTADTLTQLCTGWFRWTNAVVENQPHMLSLRKTTLRPWLVTLRSWGSTLSLCYAISHPDRARALWLRGIFMCRRSELLFFYQDGASHLFPDKFQPYREHIPEEERGDM